jgi:hypothetical protein
MATCRICKSKFEKRSISHIACSVDCAIQVGKIAAEKKAKKEHKLAKERIKTRPMWLKEAQTIFNKWIRLRDERLPCISCQKHHRGQYHAGHYLSVGARPELRFNELNCHKQCQPCNTHLSGNLVLYRKHLIEKIGLSNVEWLEGNHNTPKLTIDSIKSIIEKYKKLNKEYQNED